MDILLPNIRDWTEDGRGGRLAATATLRLQRGAILKSKHFCETTQKRHGEADPLDAAQATRWTI
jgi:hypothetical protein